LKARRLEARLFLFIDKQQSLEEFARKSDFMQIYAAVFVAKEAVFM
jgi:phosphopantetheinyl transferase (holo-ACP synthase)